MRGVGVAYTHGAGCGTLRTMTTSRASVRVLRRALLVAVTALLLVLVATWARFRVSFSREQTIVARVKYKFIDLGQGDLLRVYFEHYVQTERLWLDSADPAWIYVPHEVHEECWAGIRPDSKTHTREIAFTVRKLSFGSGYAPAENIRVAQVEGRPLITK
jgi:hypothetical protein